MIVTNDDGTVELRHGDQTVTLSAIRFGMLRELDDLHRDTVLAVARQALDAADEFGDIPDDADARTRTRIRLDQQEAARGLTREVEDARVAWWQRVLDVLPAGAKDRRTADDWRADPPGWMATDEAAILRLLTHWRLSPPPSGG